MAEFYLRHHMTGATIHAKPTCGRRGYQGGAETITREEAQRLADRGYVRLCAVCGAHTALRYVRLCAACGAHTALREV